MSATTVGEAFLFRIVHTRRGERHPDEAASPLEEPKRAAPSWARAGIDHDACQMGRIIDLGQSSMMPLTAVLEHSVQATVTAQIFTNIKDFILTNKERVLIVDDDPAMLRGVARVLRQHGYDSVQFSSVEAFRAYGDYEKATCIILDINLNDGSGIQLRRGLKAAGIDVPVIYITANDNPAVRAAALQSGCLAYLTKPFSANSLVEPLKRASEGLT